MPSRKKIKGKARRAAKAAKEEESQAVVASADQQRQEEGSLEAHVQRLQITDATFNCKHGQLKEMATSSDTSTLSSQDM